MLETKPKNIIGVFDSGLGGLTVFKYFLSDLPEYSYIYFGDNARLPYGTKSQETIYEYTREAVEFLFKQGCNLIIIACNTASSQALRKIQQEYLPKHYPNRRVLGVIRPLVEEITNNKNLKRVGILGTKATINSKAYEIELKKINPKIEVVSQGAPLLVPLIEEGYLDRPETKMILKKYLHPLKTKQVDALILACTHYPFLYKKIIKIMGKSTKVPHPGEIISASLKKYLSRHEELGLSQGKKPEVNYYTSDNPKLFKELAEKFLARKISNLKQVDITEF
ncbi:MAG: glutamate racemase [Patescibacteria group bacterium]